LVWFYRKSFLEKNDIKILPTPGASYQDTSFNIEALAVVNKVAHTKKVYLHYRTDNASFSVKSKAKLEAVSKEYAEVDCCF